MAAEQRFTDLQAKWRAAAKAQRDMRIDLAVRYGQGNACYAKFAERKRLEILDRKERRAGDRFVAFLTTISARDWCSGVPLSWLRESLTFSDATTRGPLSVVPSPAYGYTDRNMQSFAAQVQP